MEENLLKIGDAAKFLGITPQTLRNWAESGKLPPDFVSPGGHRFYRHQTLEQLTTNLGALAERWATSPTPTTLDPEQYCQTRDVFESRVRSFEHTLASLPDLAGLAPVIAAAIGEIGNNAFDHNIGNWPDEPGIFFAYDLHKRHVVVADRGRGLLATLQRVKPSLQTDAEALYTAFHEVLSGRAPEERGNGLKFVRNKVVRKFNLPFSFQSGNAALIYDPTVGDLVPKRVFRPLRGTFAVLAFPPQPVV